VGCVLVNSKYLTGVQCTVPDEHLQVRFIEEHNDTILTNVNINHRDELVLVLYWWLYLKNFY
jgi:hypothetical protein